MNYIAYINLKTNMLNFFQKLSPPLIQMQLYYNVIEFECNLCSISIVRVPFN